MGSNLSAKLSKRDDQKVTCQIPIKSTDERISLTVVSTHAVCGSRGMIYPVVVENPIIQNVGNRIVALKAVELSGEINEIEKLKKEFEILSSLSSHPMYHDGVVQSYLQPFIVDDLEDIVDGEEVKVVHPSEGGEEVKEDEHAQYFCFLMEYCDFTLDQILLSMEGGKSEVPFEMKVLHCLELFDCTDYLHKQKLIHRDLRPDNIMVSKRNIQVGDGVVQSYYQLKVIDFGNSTKKRVCSGQQNSGGVTLIFTAPEVFRKEKFDSRVDVWSIGITVMLWLCGFSLSPLQRKRKYIPHIQEISADLEKMYQEIKDLKTENSTYEMDVRKYFLKIVKMRRSILDLESDSELSRMRTELFTFVLEKMITKYETRSSFSECWRFVKHFLQDYLMEASLINFRAASTVLKRVNKFLFWNKCRSIPQFKEYVLVDEYLTNDLILFDVVFYGATHPHPITRDMKEKNPFFHLMLMFGVMHENLDFHSSMIIFPSEVQRVWDVVSMNQSKDNAKMLTLRMKFVRSHCSKYCSYRKCMKTRNKSFIRCNNEQKHKCIFFYCSKRCRDVDSKFHGRKCHLFTDNSALLPQLNSVSEEWKTAWNDLNLEFVEDVINSCGSFFPFPSLNVSKRWKMFQSISQSQSEYSVLLRKAVRSSDIMSKMTNPKQGTFVTHQRGVLDFLFENVHKIIGHKIALHWEEEISTKRLVLDEALRNYILEKRMRLRIIDLAIESAHSVNCLMNMSRAYVFLFHASHSNKGAANANSEGYIKVVHTANFVAKNMNKYLNRKERKLHDMEEITIRDLKVNRISVNKKLKLKILNEGSDILGRHFIVEDMDKKVLRLVVYNMLSLQKERFIKGSRIVVSHPYLKIARSGEPTIRVDRCDNVRISPNLINVLFDPTSEREKCLEMGKDCFKSGDICSAVRFYSRALSNCLADGQANNDDFLRIYNNLTVCSLRMRNFQKAYHYSGFEADAYWEEELENVSSELEKKSRYLKATVLLLVGKFEELGKFLEVNRELLQEREIKLLNERIHLAKSIFKGSVDLFEIVKNPKSVIVDFMSKNCSLIGDKLICTDTIDKREYIIITKSEASHTFENSVMDKLFCFEQFGENRVFKPYELAIREKFMNLMDSNKNISREIFHGNDKEGMDFISEFTDKCTFSGFSRSPMDQFLKKVPPQISGEKLTSNLEVQHLFLKTRGFSHQCKANCRWEVYGDVMVIISLKEIQRGESFTLNFYPYDRDRVNKLPNCSCEICRLGKSIKNRLQLSERVKGVCSGYVSKSKIMKIFQYLQKEYPKNVFCVDYYVTLLLVSFRSGHNDSVRSIFLELLRIWESQKGTFYMLLQGICAISHDVSAPLFEEYRERLKNLFLECYGKHSMRLFHVFMKDTCVVCKKDAMEVSFMICSVCKSEKELFCGKRCFKKAWKKHKEKCKKKY